MLVTHDLKKLSEWPTQSRSFARSNCSKSAHRKRSIIILRLYCCRIRRPRRLYRGVVSGAQFRREFGNFSCSRRYVRAGQSDDPSTRPSTPQPTCILRHRRRARVSWRRNPLPPASPLGDAVHLEQRKPVHWPVGHRVPIDVHIPPPWSLADAVSDPSSSFPLFQNDDRKPLRRCLSAHGPIPRRGRIGSANSQPRYFAVCWYFETPEMRTAQVAFGKVAVDKLIHSTIRTFSFSGQLLEVNCVNIETSKTK